MAIYSSLWPGEGAQLTSCDIASRKPGWVSGGGGLWLTQNGCSTHSPPTQLLSLWSPTIPTVNLPYLKHSLPIFRGLFNQSVIPSFPLRLYIQAQVAVLHGTNPDSGQTNTLFPKSLLSPAHTPPPPQALCHQVAFCSRSVFPGWKFVHPPMSSPVSFSLQQISCPFYTMLTPRHLFFY